MYGWRARIGLIQPTHRGKTFSFWYRNAPEGVEIVPTFIGFRTGERQKFLEGLERAEQLVADLKAVKCDIVLAAGTPPFLMKGLDWERAWAAQTSQRLGIPIVTAMEPHAIAMQAMGVRRVAVATYYHDELNQAIVDYLARFEIEGVLIGGFSLSGESDHLYATPMMALDEVSYMHVYQYCKRGFQKVGAGVDAIYINGSGWDAARAVEMLERDLKVPVIWAQAADMWLVYHKLAIANPVQENGLLLRGDHVPR
jgi:maleate cis-trans isomerase